MNIIQIMMVFFQNLFLKIYDKQDRDLSDANWHNKKDKYPEKETLKKHTQIYKPNKGKIIFSSPVDESRPYVTSPYGWRILYKGAKRSFHSGTDFRAFAKSPTKAVEDCIIIEIVRLNPKAKNRFKYVKGRPVSQNNGAVTPRIVYKGVHTGNIYKHMHCQRNGRLRIGQEIKSGQTIGHYGDYGYSLGSHCHFEVHVWNGKKHKRVNPRVWLKKRASILSVGRTRSITEDAYKNFEVGK